MKKWITGIVVGLVLLSPSPAAAATSCGAASPTKGSIGEAGLIGGLAIVAYFLVAVWISRNWNPLTIVMGADGRLSTSKFQFFLWTGVIVFSYVWLSAARAYNGCYDPINDFPVHVLTAMGFSVVTVAGAKAITVSYQAAGRITKAANSQPTGLDVNNLVSSDDGIPDLTKIQMLIWTFIAAGIYLTQVTGQINAYATCLPSAHSCAFPDIDGALMVLTGLGQGAYLGNKLAG